MYLQVDDAFIHEWEPRYDDKGVGDDYQDYVDLIQVVSAEVRQIGTLSMKTFLSIWKWKGALRVIRHVKLDEYELRYAPAFARAYSSPPERKLHALLADDVKLPGVEAPTGSTLIHFMFPDLMPIIDVRTVEVLYHAGRISTKLRDLAHYEEFRRAIDQIRQECDEPWTIRQIDKALFAYHKVVLEPATRSPSALRGRSERGNSRSMVRATEEIPVVKDSEGVYRVGGTRVTLDLVVPAFNRGATAEEIAQKFPALRLADVYQVIGYYLKHHVELDGYLKTRASAEASILADHPERSPADLRERLARSGASHSTDSEALAWREMLKEALDRTGGPLTDEERAWADNVLLGKKE